MRRLAPLLVALLLAAAVLSSWTLDAWSMEAAGRRGGLPEGSNIYTTRPPYIFYHNVGLLNLMITNVGVIGNPGFTDGVAAGWRGGEYLYAAALWVGAIASDNLPYVSTGAYEYEFRPSLDAIDTIYPAYEGIQGGNRPGFSVAPDDDNDGRVDEDPHNGRDDDEDGQIDEDYSAISQQMYSCEYWDYTQEAVNAYPEHRPLNLRIRQSSFAWSTEGSNEFVGFDFKIVNEGFEVLRKVYIGFFVDSDVGPKATPGYYTDDRGNFYSRDTTVVDVTNQFKCNDREGDEVDCGRQELGLAICYMFDVLDDGGSANGGDVAGYFGGMFLGHTTDPFGVMAPKKVKIHTAQFFSGSGAYPAGDPRNDFERYDLLSSGSQIKRPTGQPGDYRYLFSAGPFAELSPGSELELQTAFVIGTGQEGMLRNAVSAQRVYNGAWRDVDNNNRTGRNGRETCLFILPDQPPLIWRDPCDSLNPETRVIKDTVCLEENYVDNDCNCCTPLYRTNQEALTNGYETLINWVGTVAPPPPSTNNDPQWAPYVGAPPSPDALTIADPERDRRVVVQWDNLSELTADATRQIILFSPPDTTTCAVDSVTGLPRFRWKGGGGYRIWRVEGWARPIGSTGPTPEEWQMIADLSYRPADSLGPESPYYLPKYRRYPPVGPDSLDLRETGSICGSQDSLWYYPPGHYQYVDSLGLKNGMVYFYDVTAYSVSGKNELAGRPAASESERIVPRWDATTQGDEIIVVPNPYIRGGQPTGWDLTPSDVDPTGTKIAFARLPRGDCTVKIFTLSGDLVQTLTNDGRQGNGTVFWNLISRNGQDIVSGVYLYSVECKDCEEGVKGCGDRKIGRFTVVR